jgi:hypothetical protein
MTINRKGRLTKWDQIQTALKNACNINQVYDILEQFRLTNAENCQIAQSWVREQRVKGLFV